MAAVQVVARVVEGRAGAGRQGEVVAEASMGAVQWEAAEKALEQKAAAATEVVAMGAAERAAVAAAAVQSRCKCRWRGPWQHTRQRDRRL